MHNSLQLLFTLENALFKIVDQNRSHFGGEDELSRTKKLHDARGPCGNKRFASSVAAAIISYYLHDTHDWKIRSRSRGVRTSISFKNPRGRRAHHRIKTPTMNFQNGTAASAPPPDVGNNRLNPSMAIIIVVLIGACLAVALFSMYIRRCTQGNNDNPTRGASRRNGNLSIHFFERPGEGLERAIIDTLPMVSFSVVKTLKAGKEDLECAVCLEMFEDDESLRLLPKCSHVFHTECIDEWFGNHSTCPLCRTSLKATIEEVQAGVPVVGEVSRRILEAQEELFGSARVAFDDSSVLDENEVLEESSSNLDRNSERNSARMAFFRNSDSFRQAARGVEVRERLASLSARYPASSSSTEAYKGPQRASSLSCVSLQRTNSSNAATGTREFYNSEVLFKYGSQRFGAAGAASLHNSLGRLGSLNERVLQPDHGNGEEAAASSSSEHWITLELTASDSQPKSTQLTENSETVPAVISDTRPMLGKPRSGPLIGKQLRHPAAHRKSGSLRGLKGSLVPLHRSASEGRAQFFSIEPLPASTASVSETDNTNISTNSSGTLAQRTMLWLSGHKHTRSSSARASNSTALQQIVTE